MKFLVVLISFAFLLCGCSTRCGKDTSYKNMCAKNKNIDDKAVIVLKINDLYSNNNWLSKISYLPFIYTFENKDTKTKFFVESNSSNNKYEIQVIDPGTYSLLSITFGYITWYGFDTKFSVKTRTVSYVGDFSYNIKKKCVELIDNFVQTRSILFQKYPEIAEKMTNNIAISVRYIPIEF